MAKTREKKPVMTVKTIEEAERVLAEYATDDARLQKLNATMDEQITAIRNKFDDQVRELTESKEDKLNELQHFAESNAQLFDKKKSIQFVHGAIGFRMGTPKVKPLKKFTWGAITELLKDRAPEYTRVVTEPAKDLMIANREDEDLKRIASKCGFEIVQEETFFVDLKKEGE